jgi:hypothetical protein
MDAPPSQPLAAEASGRRGVLVDVHDTLCCFARWAREQPWCPDCGEVEGHKPECVIAPVLALVEPVANVLSGDAS